MGSFVANGSVRASLRPHFVRVITDDVFDAYPMNTAARILFDATVIDPITGLPAEGSAFSVGNGGLTADITDLNADVWDFIRFQVEFDLDTGGGGVDLDSPRPGLDVLKMEFRF